MVIYDTYTVTVRMYRCKFWCLEIVLIVDYDCQGGG